MTEEKSSENNASVAGENRQEFIIQKIYVKDASFEAPGTPGIYSEKWEPQINLELNTAGKGLENDIHEVVLTLTVTAKLGEKTAFLIEVQQAGLFTVRGLNEQELSHALGSYCPNILFPYAREVVSDLVNKGGFPQLLLSPVNFDALYAQHMQRMQQQAGEQSASPEAAH